MTTMRGTRVKIFLYLCAIFIISGLVVCFKNAISQVDDEKKNNEICRQQQENLSTQLQGNQDNTLIIWTSPSFVSFSVISDYKQRLENSLKSEKAEHQQTKINNEIKANEEKLKSEKIMNEAKNKFNSLQQHFNLLQVFRIQFKQTLYVLTISAFRRSTTTSRKPPVEYRRSNWRRSTTCNLNSPKCRNNSRKSKRLKKAWRYFWV